MRISDSTSAAVGALFSRTDSQANPASSALCSGVSFISLVAPSESVFYETVTFYTDLGFEETAVYDRTRSDQKREAAHCILSEKETWLYSQGDGSDTGTDITLKIRLVRDGANDAQVKGSDPVPAAANDDKDWRGYRQSVVMYAPQLDRVVEQLSVKNIKFQLQPNDTTPIELYTHDPLGTLVGFTTRHNPFTTKAAHGPTLVLPDGLGGGASHTFGLTPFQSRPRTPVEPEPVKKKKIAVMTSGGDAPGMNGAVRAVVRMSIARGCIPYAIYDGYEGLLKGGDMIKQMQWEDVRGWLSEGGTLIGTARCKEFRERKGRLAGAKNLLINGIDALIVCGGDGSLTGADLFRAEWPSLLDELLEKGEVTPEQVEGHRELNIVGMVGSIDNDMTGTDATIGCYSSLTRICQSVDFIDATAYSHSRAFVIEVMGRHCGWLALMAGVACGADFVFIPEKPPAAGWENEMCEVIMNVGFSSDPDKERC